MGKLSGRIAVGHRKLAGMAGFVLDTDFGRFRGITVLATLRDAENIAIGESSRGGGDSNMGLI